VSTRLWSITLCQD